MTYTFDELLAPGAPAGAAFGLIDANGDRSSGSGAVLQVIDNKVTVRFATAGSSPRRRPAPPIAARWAIAHRSPSRAR